MIHDLEISCGMDVSAEIEDALKQELRKKKLNILLDNKITDSSINKKE